MATQLEEARSGNLTPAMRACAEAERVPPEAIRDEVACGHAVIPCNPRHEGLAPVVVGRAFRTKVNANIGRSTERSSLGQELSKLRIALDARADFVMDLSVGEDLPAVREAILRQCPAPLGTVSLPSAPEYKPRAASRQVAEGPFAEGLSPLPERARMTPLASGSGDPERTARGWSPRLRSPRPGRIPSRNPKMPRVSATRRIDGSESGSLRSHRECQEDGARGG